MSESLMNVSDIAKYLGLSERTIYSMIKHGEIPYIKVGGRYRFNREQIEEWLQHKSKEKMPTALQRVKEIADPLTKIMRKISWDEYKPKRAGYAKIKAELGFERKSSSRVRDAEERNLLLQLDKARLDLWKKEGKYEILGPRKIKFRIH